MIHTHEHQLEIKVKERAERIASSLLLSLSVGVSAGCYLCSFAGGITAFMISLVYLSK